jgi:hypothetical protein
VPARTPKYWNQLVILAQNEGRLIRTHQSVTLFRPCQRSLVSSPAEDRLHFCLANYFNRVRPLPLLAPGPNSTITIVLPLPQRHVLKMIGSWQLWLSPRPRNRTNTAAQPIAWAAADEILYEFQQEKDGRRNVKETHFLDKDNVRKGLSGPPLYAGSC